MFIANEFVVVVIALLAGLAGLYIFRVVLSVRGSITKAGPDFEERAAELLDAYRRGRLNVVEPGGKRGAFETENRMNED